MGVHTALEGVKDPRNENRLQKGECLRDLYKSEAFVDKPTYGEHRVENHKISAIPSRIPPYSIRQKDEGVLSYAIRHLQALVNTNDVRSIYP